MLTLSFNIGLSSRVVIFFIFYFLQCESDIPFAKT